MTKPKKSLVKSNQEEEKKRKDARDSRTAKFVELVDIVRGDYPQKEQERAFEEIVEMMKSRITQLSYKMNISGFQRDDLIQESLVALCFKAIKDYDKDRSNFTEVSPFDSFATLCIRRHLSTKFKNSFQGKKKVLNTAISLDQDRSKNSGGEEFMSLSDVLPFTSKDPIAELESAENYKILLAELWSRLSVLEKQVFVLYKRNLSYEEIEAAINRKNETDGKAVINIKSVDNALSRIKTKAKQVYKYYMN